MSADIETNLEGLKIEVALAEARQAAERLGVSVNIALVDAGGNLAGFLRMPGAYLTSIDLAIDKAFSASSFGMATRSFGDLLDRSSPRTAEGLRRRPRVTDIPGGLPIRLGSHLLGGIGVSGASEEQDEVIAHAGLACIIKAQAALLGEDCHGA